MSSISYFPHDSNARNSKKLIRLRMKHGAAGYGVYFMLIERLTEETNYSSDLDYDMLAFDLKVKKELVRSVIENFDLFEIFEGQGSTATKPKFRSCGLLERMEIRAIRSAAGRRGAANRWNNNSSNSPQSGYQGKELSIPDTAPQYGEPMANEDFANGKSMANAPVANGIKENNICESKNNNPFFYVFPFFNGTDLAVLAYLVLAKNICNAEKELEKLIAYNTLEKGKNWENMKIKERIAAATLWTPRNKTGKYSDNYRNLWIGIIEKMAITCSDIELIYTALKDDCKEGYVDNENDYVFRVAPSIMTWMEDNAELIRGIINDFRRALGCKGIGYEEPTENEKK